MAPLNLRFFIVLYRLSFFVLYVCFLFTLLWSDLIEKLKSGWGQSGEAAAARSPCLI